MSRLVWRLRRRFPCVCLLIFASLLWGSQIPPALAQEWSVNKGKSIVTLQLSMDGQPVAGRFAAYRTEISFDPEEPSDGKIAAIIDATSIRTGNPERDAALFSPAWLNGGAFPDIKIASRGIKEIDAGTYRMQTDVTIKGVTKRVVVPISIEDQGADGRIHAEIRLPQSDFGIGAGAGDAMAIVIDFSATHLTN